MAFQFTMNMAGYYLIAVYPNDLKRFILPDSLHCPMKYKYLAWPEIPRITLLRCGPVQRYIPSDLNAVSNLSSFVSGLFGSFP